MIVTSVCLSIVLSAAAETKDKADDNIAKGWQEVSFFNFKLAKEFFDQAVKANPVDSDEWIEASYGRAISLQHIVPPSPDYIAESEETFLLLAERYPDHRCAPRSLLNAARIAELVDYYQDPPRTEQARRLYREVIRRWGDLPIAGETTLRLAESYMRTFEPEQVRKGIEILKEWLDLHPNDPLASAMWQVMGDACFDPLKEYRKACRYYVLADDLGLIDEGRKILVYWRLATLARRELEDRELAVEYYTKIVNFTPTSGKAYEAQVALKKLGAPVPELSIGLKIQMGDEKTEGPEENETP
jgi:tetratricopeptide (TPR) repeat protein